jgi:hypothetical protein
MIFYLSRRDQLIALAAQAAVYVGYGPKLPRADATACPLLAKADVRALTRGSGFDPQETLAAVTRA